MPRTKVSKNTKRNRDAAKEEKLREFDALADQLISAIDDKIQEDVDEIMQEINMIRDRLPSQILTMKMGDLLSMHINTFSEFQDMQDSQNATTRLLQNASSVISTGKKSKDDEGYLTEDSTPGSCVFAHLAVPNRGRTPGPLSSAKAKSRTRRSQSANGILGSAIKPKLTTDHASRSKLRTPMSARPKAASSDRAPATPKMIPSSPAALLRYPKPGETVISMSGSPVVANALPESFANVNIPIRNGVLSLRPNKMQSVDPEIIEKIDADTLRQIKMLQSNLNVIMSHVERL